MKFKRLISIFMALFLVLPSFAFAEDKVHFFEDTNAISNFDNNLNIVVSEFNSGKIVSKRNDEKVVSFKNLATYYALYTLSENLKTKKITLDSELNLTSGKVTTKDLIFNLVAEENNAVLSSVFNYFNVDVAKVNNFFDSASLLKTKLNSLTLDDNNKTTSREISYLANLTLKNAPEILDITKNPKNNDKDNSVKFLPSNTFRVLGISYAKMGSVSVAYSGETRFIISILGDTGDKDKFFENLQKTYTHLFANYSYKLALKKGTYDINNENVTLEYDLYDLFYNQHSIKDVKYLLMNDKILLFQNYETLNLNMGIVFSDFIPNTKNSTLTKIKNTFVGDLNFDKKKQSEKVSIVLERTQYFAGIFLFIYSLVFVLAYIVGKIFKRR